MRMRGLEPPPGYPDTDLNRASAKNMGRPASRTSHITALRSSCGRISRGDCCRTVATPDNQTKALPRPSLTRSSTAMAPCCLRRARPVGAPEQRPCRGAAARAPSLGDPTSRGCAAATTRHGGPARRRRRVGRAHCDDPVLARRVSPGARDSPTGRGRRPPVRWAHPAEMRSAPAHRELRRLTDGDTHPPPSAVAPREIERGAAFRIAAPL